MIVISYGRKSLIQCFLQLLIDQGANVNAKDNSGTTALEYAVWLEDLGMIKVSPSSQVKGKLHHLTKTVCSFDWF